MSVLIPEQRRRALLDALRDAGVLTIREAVDLLQVSHMTIRRDIAELERGGVVVAVTGGVQLVKGSRPPAARSARSGLEKEQKSLIASRAAAMVHDGMAVYLDAGTTCEAIARELRARANLTVVTSDFVTAMVLIESPNVHVIHTGGTVDPESASSEGLFAAATAAAANTDICFLSTGAWDLRSGVTTTSQEKVAVKRAALGSSARAVLVAGGSKYGVTERFTVAPLADISTIVTDRNLPAVAQNAIAALGIPLIDATSPSEAATSTKRSADG